jgi:conjugative transfer region protein (TIGR03748 family)
LTNLAECALKLLAAIFTGLGCLTVGCATVDAPVALPAPAQSAVANAAIPNAAIPKALDPLASGPGARQATQTPPPISAQAPAPSDASLARNETVVARYTTVTTLPAEADANPMAVIAKVHFPREVVNTVAEAVRYVLVRTGYRLVPDDALDARVRTIFALRLPDNQRVLGPYRVDAMLSVLMGHPYRFVADSETRTARYVVPGGGTNAPAPTAPAAFAPASDLPSAGQVAHVTPAVSARAVADLEQ